MSGALALALLGLVTAAPAAPTAPPPVVTPNTGAAMRQFATLIDKRLATTGEARDRIDADIRKKYEQPLAVMITDMSGFTELTKKHGILGFLSEIRRLQRLAEPVISKRGGKWLKADADDLFVIHRSAADMLQLARDLQAAVAASNQTTDWKMGLAIGLGFGPTLLIGDEDIWGDPVNTASKLGEDTAEANEILVTEQFFAQLKTELEAKKQPIPACTRVEAQTRGTKFPFFVCQ